MVSIMYRSLIDLPVLTWGTRETKGADQRQVGTKPLTGTT